MDMISDGDPHKGDLVLFKYGRYKNTYGFVLKVNPKTYTVLPVQDCLNERKDKPSNIKKHNLELVRHIPDPNYMHILPMLFYSDMIKYNMTYRIDYFSEDDESSTSTVSFPNIVTNDESNETSNYYYTDSSNETESNQLDICLESYEEINAQAQSNFPSQCPQPLTKKSDSSSYSSEEDDFEDNVPLCMLK